MGYRVLIADGNPDGAEWLAEVFRLHGHDPATATTGPGTLALAAATDPDVVFLGIDLPGLDGYEVCRQLRAGDAGARLRVIVALTGYGDDDARRKAEAAGFDHHVLKPARPSELLALLPHCGATP